MSSTTTWTTIATVKLICAPSMMRLSRSRPSWSVPSTWPSVIGGIGPLYGAVAATSCCW